MKNKTRPISLALGVVLIVGILSSTMVFSMELESEETLQNENLYEINTADDLQNINDDVNADYVLANDIDASDTGDWNDGEGFLPIGDEFDIGEFTGTFDGQGHSITGLYINRTSSDIGLFGRIGEGAVIRDVSLIDVDITGYGDVGGLIGQNNEGLVQDIHISGYVRGESTVGGLIGYNWAGIVEDSSVTADVYGIDAFSLWGTVGGLIGYNYMGTVERSYATGDVIAEDGVQIGGLIGANRGSFANEVEVLSSYATGRVIGREDVGGLIGWNAELATLNDVYSVGDVTGNENVGGLIGSNEGHLNTVSNAYSTGKVSGEESVGGLIGFIDDDAIVENSFWDSDTSEQSESMGGTPKTTEEMKDVATFTDLSTDGLDEPWDFVDNPNDDSGFKEIWDIDGRTNVGYPYLTQEIVEEIELPVLDITHPFDGQTIYSTEVVVEWETEQGTYPISHHEIQVSGENWQDIGITNSYTLDELEEGEYTINLRVFDDEDNRVEDSVDFNVFIDDDEDPIDDEDPVDDDDPVDEPEDDEEEDDDDDGIPGFNFILLTTATIIALLIYKIRKR